MSGDIASPLTALADIPGEGQVLEFFLQFAKNMRYRTPDTLPPDRTKFFASVCTAALSGTKRTPEAAPPPPRRAPSLKAMARRQRGSRN
jgi:hypothetical protein